MTPPFLGKCSPFIGTNDFTIRVSKQNQIRHYRIKKTDADLLCRGAKKTDIYLIDSETRAGSIIRMNEYYRLKLGFLQGFCKIERLNLLITGRYWYAPVNDWCNEIQAVRV